MISEKKSEIFFLKKKQVKKNPYFLRAHFFHNTKSWWEVSYKTNLDTFSKGIRIFQNMFWEQNEVTK